MTLMYDRALRLLTSEAFKKGKIKPVEKVLGPTRQTVQYLIKKSLTLY